MVATKIDSLDEPGRLEGLKKRAKKDKKPFFAISAVTNLGVKELVNYVSSALDAENEAEAERSAAAARDASGSAYVSTK